MHDRGATASDSRGFWRARAGFSSRTRDGVALMQAGRIVETGVTVEIFEDPKHPYTRQPLSSIPGRDWKPPDSWSDAA